MKAQFIIPFNTFKRKIIRKKCKHKDRDYGIDQPLSGRGCIDVVEYKDGRLIISGWLFVQDISFDKFIVKINNKSFGEVNPIKRSDVQNVFPFMHGALMSGFDFNPPVRKELLGNWVNIDIIGTYKGEELGRIRTIYRTDFYDSLPEPPSKLMKRVTNIENPVGYWNSAAMSFGEFSKAIKKYRDITSINRLLDWGCGCGRLTSLFLKYSPVTEIYGCDIDQEAVGWCIENLQKAIISVIKPYPPTHYKDMMFDVVIGYSVFTHLTRDVQQQWLKEINRIIAPGGLFVTSVHGEFASKFVSSDIQNDIRNSGISDIMLDSNLDGIAPNGYYRGVFQTKLYTQKEWGKYFNILEYIDAGVSNYQALVIMEKVN